MLIALTSVAISIGMQLFTIPVSTYPGDEWLRDRFIRWHANSLPEERFVLLDIDETSIAQIGPWPWSRSQIADLVEQLLGEYGAAGVALDLVFPESGDAAGDMRLSKLGEFGPVVFAQAFDYNALQSWPLRIGKVSGGIINSEQTTIASSATANGFIANHAGLSSVKTTGNIGFIPDSDGTLRRLPLLTQFQGRTYPTLAKALFDCCHHSVSQHNPLSLISGIQLDKQGMLRIPYSRSLDAYRGKSVADILKRKAIAKHDIQGKLVLIGSTSLSLSDRVSTPLSPSTAGFLVHASLLSTLFDLQEGIVPIQVPGKLLAIIYSVLLGLLVFYTFPRLSAVLNSFILLLASALWCMLSYVMASADALFSPTGPLLSHFFLITIAVPFGWQTSQEKSRRLLGTLKQYVAKAVVDELLASDLKDPLAPRKLYVTTLIADMEGYTKQVEYLTIEEAANLTREFLERLTVPVLAQNGTLDKFTGDGLVAFWGAPLPVANHADPALDAAIQIVKNIRQFSAEREAKGLPSLRVRIGIESGIAMAGDFGTSSRSIYTAVGDSVNVASRLEQIAREYPHDIIVGQGTVDCSTQHQFTLLGTRMLRGREKPISLFTVEMDR